MQAQLRHYATTERLCRSGSGPNGTKVFTRSLNVASDGLDAVLCNSKAAFRSEVIRHGPLKQACYCYLSCFLPAENTDLFRPVSLLNNPPVTPPQREISGNVLKNKQSLQTSLYALERFAKIRAKAKGSRDSASRLREQNVRRLSLRRNDLPPKQLATWVSTTQKK